MTDKTSCLYWCVIQHVFCSTVTCSVPPNMFSALQWHILFHQTWFLVYNSTHFLSTDPSFQLADGSGTDQTGPVAPGPHQTESGTIPAHPQDVSKTTTNNRKKYLHLWTALHAKTHNTMKAYWRPGCTNNLCNDVFKIFIIIFLFSMLRNMEQLESASKTKTDAGVTFQFSCRHMYLAETKLFLFITLVDISCLFWANVLSCVFIGCSNILCYISMASNHVPSMHFMSIKLCNQIL